MPEYNFLRMKAAWAADGLAIVGVLDGFQQFAPTCQCLTCRRDGNSAWRWGGDVLDAFLVGLTSFQRPGTSRRRMCGLSAEGDVVFFDDTLIKERIFGAGIASADSRFYGRMHAICGVGDTLFACGEGGQIYRRECEGAWRCLAPELLQTPDKANAFTVDVFSALGGPAPDDVYVVGRFGKILHWDGGNVRALGSPTQNDLVAIWVENPNSIWISGAQGTLLRGDARRGFDLMPGIVDNHHLNSVCIFEGRTFLASALGEEAGLYSYDNGRMERVLTGLAPEPKLIDWVDAGAGVLWAVGSKDIVRFDGKTWERIDFPSKRGALK